MPGHLIYLSNDFNNEIIVEKKNKDLNQIIDGLEELDLNKTR